MCFVLHQRLMASVAVCLARMASKMPHPRGKGHAIGQELSSMADAVDYCKRGYLCKVKHGRKQSSAVRRRTLKIGGQPATL